MDFYLSEDEVKSLEQEHQQTILYVIKKRMMKELITPIELIELENDIENRIKEIQEDIKSKFDNGELTCEYEPKKVEKVEEVVELKQILKQVKQKNLDISNKTFLTVSDVEILYNIGKTQQHHLRSRKEDPLVGYSQVRGGKITYKVDEIKEWMERNLNKTRLAKRF